MYSYSLLRKRYEPHIRNKNFWVSFFLSFLFLLVSLVVNYFAGQYATEKGSNSVTDIILSNTPVFDISFVFVYGALVFWIFVAFLCIFEPKKIPFTLKAAALFVITRSFFVTFTHIGPFPDQVIINSSTFISYFTFGGDLFFSGHTGLPYLMALIFWKNFKLRVLFICTSVFFGIIVLMGHLHYSIDVFSAFFITYGIYRMAEVFFKKDHSLFHSEI